MEKVEVNYLLCADRALTVEFGDEISEKINTQIRGFCLMIEEYGVPGITELVPTYRSVTVHYEPDIIGYDSLIEILDTIIQHLHNVSILESEVMDIPVLYGGKYGPDLDYVAQYHKMTPQQIVDIHTKPTYLIYMLGFTPGFAYMGGMDERIATPRLSTPRTLIPAGSVGIAASQTGIYPIDSPGGWQLIGQTPLALFDVGRKEPILLNAGQRIRFVPITQEEFDRIKQAGN